MIPPHLLLAEKQMYAPYGLVVKDFALEPESQEYAACEFKINGLVVKFREAKITPKKVGFFVTLWKRKADGPIEPFDVKDLFDLVVISVFSEKRLGQFVFPKNALHEMGIISDENREGKRGIRVYPPWALTENAQAIKTQKSQLSYFFEIPCNSQDRVSAIRKLFSL